jgi:phosphoribosylformylglycinamidine synthase
MRGQVVVRLKQEVLDPQGVTIAKALANLGYEGVGSLRQGKVFDVELETNDPAVARTALENMAKDLLANPVIETYEIHVLDAGLPDESLRNEDSLDRDEEHG